MIVETIAGLISIASGSLALIKRLNPTEEVSKELEAIETSITNISNNYGIEINGSNITINGDINQNKENTISPVDFEEVKERAKERAQELIAAAGNTKPKYMFYPTKNAQKQGFYFREEYSETLDRYKRIDNGIWQLDKIEAWAKENNYKVGHDFTIEPEKFHHNTY